MRLSMLALLAAMACGGPQPAENGAKTDGAGHGTDHAGTNADEDIGEVLAVVDGIEIGSKEFEAAAQRRTPADGEKLSADEKQEILQDLIDQKLLYLTARDNGIDRDPKVQKLMVQTLMRQEVYANVRNSDFNQDQLREYFESHKDEFVVPEKVQVKRIFIKSGGKRDDAAAKSFASELHSQLVSDPGQFKRLASEHSEDPYRKRGGDLGFVSEEGKPGVPEEVTSKAFQVPMNQVSEVFPSPGGYNIIMVTQKRERVERTFEQMKGSVLRKVKNDRYKELYDEYVAQARTDRNVVTHDDKLASIEVEPPKRIELGPGGFPPMPGGERPGARPPAGGGEDE